MGLILITHDLAVVSQVTEKIAVMYAGKLVESGPTRAVTNDPRHPYTQGLIRALPGSMQPGSRLHQIPGMMPTLTDIPQGCAFHPRCSIGEPVCIGCCPWQPVWPATERRCRRCACVGCPGWIQDAGSAKIGNDRYGDFGGLHRTWSIGIGMKALACRFIGYRTDPDANCPTWLSG